MVEEWLQIRIDAELKSKLEFLAAESERTMSAYVRWLIRREYERLYQAASPTLPEPETEVA